jgi:hypothetical protein
MLSATSHVFSEIIIHLYRYRKDNKVMEMRGDYQENGRTDE